MPARTKQARPRTSRPLLLSAAAVGVMGWLTAGATYSAFSGTTNTGTSTLTAGTVTITNGSSGSALYTISNTKPGDTTSACTTVTYTGSLSAGVRSYAVTTGELGPYVNLTVTRGTATDTTGGDCASFVPDPDGGVLYTGGTLAAYPSTYDTGRVDSTPQWATGETHVYRLTLSVQDDNAAQGRSASTRFTWEARS